MSKQTFLANYHSHTHFSDGRGAPEDYIQEALKQGLQCYGFSDHAPINSPFIGAMRLDQLSHYLSEIDRLKSTYKGQIEIYKSLEVDYIPGLIDVHTDYIQAAELDYLVGAVHFVDTLPNGRPWGFQSSHAIFQEGLETLFGGDIKLCVHRYYELIREMILDSQPDILAHLDRIKKLNAGYRYFNEHESWYQAEILYTLELLATTDTILEVNTKGYYCKETLETYPGKWILQEAYDMGISVHLASDAHRPENITKGFDFATQVLREVGYTSLKVMRGYQWTEMPLPKFPVGVR